MTTKGMERIYADKDAMMEQLTILTDMYNNVKSINLNTGIGTGSIPLENTDVVAAVSLLLHKANQRNILTSTDVGYMHKNFFSIRSDKGLYAWKQEFLNKLVDSTIETMRMRVQVSELQ